jgi:hypothetical protein
MRDYLVVIPDMQPYGFEVDSISAAVEALNREEPMWGAGFALKRNPDGTWTDAGIEVDEETNFYAYRGADA